VNLGKIAPAVLVALLLIVWTTDASAQDRFDIQLFNPAPGQFSGFLGTPSGRALQGGRYEVGFLTHLATNPLVLTTALGDRVSSPVSSVVTLDVLGAIGVGDWFELGLDIPLIVSQSGDVVTEVANADVSDAGFGLGDIRVIPKVVLLGPDDRVSPSGFALSLLLDTRLPTGDPDHFQGEGFRIEPRLAAELLASDAFRLGLSVGYMVRDPSELGNIQVDDSLTWSFALGIRAGDLEIVPEVFGRLSLTESTGGEETPAETLLGLKYAASDELSVTAGGGFGLITGAGTPDARVLLGLTWSPVPPRDRDADGYYDDEDGCPDEPEDFDDFEDADGCPDPDNDQDMILDVDDGCPMEPEDFDGYEDTDGCPDLDNDWDTLLDIDDACPLEPEDLDGFEDADGCPDPDNDQDMILDIDDACPDEPETVNEYYDEDGCPDEVPVLVTCEQIEISERVFFETNSAQILPRSYELLNVIAVTLRDAEYIRMVNVEGHTDSRNTDEYNLDLSRRRAESVRIYLIGRGIAESRLTSEGFGEGRPVASNETDEGLAMNRRVEFLIVEQDAQEDCVDPSE
jgi:outer membrane protein OmpA-like peptidoglycan-associated protein